MTEQTPNGTTDQADHAKLFATVSHELYGAFKTKLGPSTGLDPEYFGRALLAVAAKILADAIGPVGVQDMLSQLADEMHAMERCS